MVNHYKLFCCLLSYGVPLAIVEVLHYWYSRRGGGSRVGVSLGSDEKNDALRTQRYEMTVDNKLQLFRKDYEQRRERPDEKSGFVFTRARR